ncbi:DUF3703 domain-containing protein [Polaribacter sp. Hel1_85]|uniref:DUF3703 domain-containing protein n=1 Tax=Polaribacter sp. Hel1_85 TaxID=1250005 RepID=UPI00052E44D9|nr:DUF3703 domain-containing protein [Polaribacter sp. Hel1_85]KGL58697.1 hypothetical protein PHEL85_2963 [Polaribacter sp. Hel1_85]
MTQQLLRSEYHKHLELGKKLMKIKDYKTAFYHFENAHILGQKHLWKHTVSHYWMLILGIKTKNSKEIVGQIFRILASLLFTLIWVPKGNTGGTNISSMKEIPIRKELKQYFRE